MGIADVKRLKEFDRPSRFAKEEYLWNQTASGGSGKFRRD